MPISSRPARILLLALVALALAAGSALAATPTKTAPPKAKPSKDCAKAIIDDWYPDGRVDFLYPIPCYAKAIKSLPADLRGYGSAADDILRAQQAAKDNRPDPGRGGTTTETTTPTTPTTTESTPTTTETIPPKTTTTTQTTDTTPETTETDGFGGNVGGNAGGPDGGSGGTTVAAPAETGDSSSLPIPLIVLGGLAVLLFAAGGAGYLSRRMRSSAAPEDDPASAP